MTKCNFKCIIQTSKDILNNKQKEGGILKNKKMKIARIEKDLSQEQLADLVGATRQTIGMIESGKFNPSLQLCISICRALGKTLDDLFWEEEEKKGDTV